MMNTERISRLLPAVSLMAASLCMSGCGSLVGSADAGPVVAPVLAMGDAAYDARIFAGLFVDGAAPENRGDYARVKIEVAGEPTISDQTAQVPVKLTPRVGTVSAEGGMPAATGELPQGTVQTSWTLKKVGEGWKISEAPLR